MKIIKKILVLLVTFLFSISLFGKELSPSKDLLYGKLPNGISYYIYKNRRPKERATLNLVVKVGSTSEEDSEQGIAHFMEHMAFNGTSKYAKNDMIKYLESIGLSFGGDLNAYTSFDETVFELSIPTTSDSYIEEGIEVLRQWASEATIEESEVEGEKKVIMEEWRLDQGLSKRLGDVQKKALFEGSRYFDRFPIGLPEIIEGANSPLIKGFYKKWYQPKNISIVAVGDFEPKKIEEYIQKYFDYAGDKNSKSPKEYKIPKLKDKYVVFSDDELTYNTYTITKILDRKIVNSEESMKEYIVDELLFNILNTRLFNLRKLSDTPILNSVVYKYDINKKSDIFTMATTIKNDKLTKGIELLNNFFKSSSKNGITQEELDLEKKDFLISYEDILTNKESITNDVYASSLVETALTSETFLDIQDEFALVQKILPKIQIKDINKRLKNIYDEGTLHFLSTGTKQAKLDENSFKDVVINSINSQKEFDFSTPSPKLPPLNLVPQKIYREKDGRYTLENGIKVITKKTDFDSDKILIKFFKNEGSSTSTYPAYVNSIFAPHIIEESGVGPLLPQDVDIYFKGKNFEITPYINDYEQGFFIESDRKNLSSALEYMNYLIYSPKVDDTIFKNAIDELKENIANRNNSPKVIYQDEISKIYSGSHPRRMPLNLEDVAYISKEGILAEFKDKFDNFSNFNLIVVGSFDYPTLEENMATYFATLPSKEDSKKATSLGLKIPKNVVKKEVIKGEDKKAVVTLIFPYNKKYGYEEKTLYNGFSQVLDILLIEEIREKLGGIYTISATTSLSPNNYGEDKLKISFSADVTRVDEVKRGVFKTLENLLYQDIDERIIKSVVKNYELSYNTEVAENPFWLNYLYQVKTIPNYKLATPSEYEKLMTRENLWRVNRGAINLKNYMDITLIPKKVN